MREETWFKWFIVSFILHFLVVGIFSVPIKPRSKRIDLSSAYSVSLVGGLGGGAVSSPGPPGGASAEKEIPAAKKEPPKQAQAKKPTPAKTKPIPLRKEEKAVSLSKKKAPPAKKEVKQAKPDRKEASKDELKALADRLREIKKRTDYIDVTKRGQEGGPGSGSGGAGSGMPGLPGSGGGGGGKPMDLATQKYYMEVWEKIKAAWGLPGSSFKNLETIVTIKIKKDGRIVDINVEKRSGNRIYDESIMRALRASDPLPAIPSSLNTDILEIGFRFFPGEMS
jgi:colicin import membrane protein